MSGPAGLLLQLRLITDRAGRRRIACALHYYAFRCKLLSLDEPFLIGTGLNYMPYLLLGYN